MTKYVLQSGSIKKYPEKMEEYFSELCQGLSGEITVLWCFFATKREERDGRSKAYLEIFAPHFPSGINPMHEIAIKEEFEEQVARADIVFFQGGSSQLLMKELSDIDLEAILQNKVVTGSSAGAMMLADEYWSCDRRVCGDGFGIVPVKFIPHFNSDFCDNDSRGPIDWEAAKRKLEAYGDQSLPLYALEEGEFVVFEK